MDSVVCEQGGKVLLTIYFRNSGVLLAFLREANTARPVTELFGNAPYQKGSIEIGHEFIHKVIPKGKSLNHFQQKDISLMMDHINSYDFRGRWRDMPASGQIQGPNL